jgi:S-adenosylmethionine decarboxylase
MQAEKEVVTQVAGEKPYFEINEKGEVIPNYEFDCKHLGRHVIAEFFQADFDRLNDAAALEVAMKDAATHAGATILCSHSHFFEPHGVSAVVIISESNLCIHSWPEFGYAACDFFTCGDAVNPWKSFEYLMDYLKAKKVNASEL